MLYVENLRAGYGNIEILHGMSLRINAKEITGVLAPNGAGKSTLFKAICGLCDVYEGTIVLTHGNVKNTVQDLPIAKRVRIGIRYVPEKSEVFSSEQVEENLRLAALAIGRPWSPRVLEDEVAPLFPALLEKRRALAGTLSGGQKRMLSLAMALVQGPKVLLIDEPFAGLAPSIVAHLIESLKAMKQRGIAVAVIDHNLSATLSFSDRVLMLRLGKIVLDAARSDVTEEKVLQVFG